MMVYVQAKLCEAAISPGSHSKELGRNYLGWSGRIGCSGRKSSAMMRRKHWQS